MAPSSGSADALETGLTALKQGDYLTALAYLSDVAAQSPDAPDGIRAQMGLVVAYDRHGQAEQAISLCQTLLQNPSPKVNAWATRTLADLVQRHPQLTPERSNSSEPEPADPEPADLEPETNVVGFVPFESSAPPKASSKRPTPKHVAVKVQPPPPVTPPKPPSEPIAPPSIDNPSRSGFDPDLFPTESSEPLSGESETDAGIPSESPIAADFPPFTPEWRQAGRAKHWQSLGKIKLVWFWILQGATVLVFFWMMQVLVESAMLLTNQWLLWLRLAPIQFFYQSQTLVLLVISVGLLGVAPWLLSFHLKLFEGLQPLPMATLARHSPEATRVLSQFSRQHKSPHPELGVLPTATPIALTYGFIPHNARIVVSQGLLDRLSADEIATVYASELGHVIRWDFVVMTWIMVVLQIPYTLYSQVAVLGDTLNFKRRSAIGFVKLLWGAGFCATVGLSSLSYGIYRLLRLPVLWLSRRRVYYSDRLAIEATGNPNGLTRALLKLAIGITEDLQQRGQTSHLLESFDFLAPVGYLQVLTPGSLHFHIPLEPALEWDYTNPYRAWLTLSSSHPRLGDRLFALAQYTRQYRLETELNCRPLPPTVKPTLNQRIRYWQRLLLQGAPFFGAPIGFAIGSLLWLLGEVANLVDFWFISWLSGDRAILLGCLYIGLSLGQFIRLNRFFPDAQVSSTLKPASSLPMLLNQPEVIPLDTQHVQLQGRLLGRRGVSNWLGQDLLLQTQQGMIKLHHASALGALGTLCSPALRPAELVGQRTALTGWFRRGATCWIDLETLQTKDSQPIHSNHPLWSALLGTGFALWGVYIVLVWSTQPGG